MADVVNVGKLSVAEEHLLVRALQKYADALDRQIERAGIPLAKQALQKERSDLEALSTKLAGR